MICNHGSSFLESSLVNPMASNLISEVITLDIILLANTKFAQFMNNKIMKPISRPFQMINGINAFHYYTYLE